MDPNSDVIISTLLPMLGYMLICSQRDSENKLSHSRILTALGGFPYAELISDRVTTVQDLVKGSQGEAGERDWRALRRICHCDIESKTYKSELEYRAFVKDTKLKPTYIRYPEHTPFEIGYVEDNYGRKLLWIISPILKEVILDLLMPHPGLCSRANL